LGAATLVLSHDTTAPRSHGPRKGDVLFWSWLFITDAGYGLLMITTIGYVAGSDNQASLNVSSAAGFLGAVARVRAGGARKLFSLKAFRAARLNTLDAAKLILALLGW